MIAAAAVVGVIIFAVYKYLSADDYDDFEDFEDDFDDDFEDDFEDMDDFETPEEAGNKRRLILQAKPRRI